MTVKHISEATPAGESTLSASPEQRPCILVVEDDPDIRHLNTEMLASAGYQVDAAEDGAAAWELLQFYRYDLMVTDQQMPKLTGLELLQKLHDARLDLLVIVATGTPIQQLLERTPWLQVKAVLQKPYAFNELLDLVKNILHLAASPSGQITASVDRQSQNGSRSLQA